MKDIKDRLKEDENRHLRISFELVNTLKVNKDWIYGEYGNIIRNLLSVADNEEIKTCIKILHKGARPRATVKGDCNCCKHTVYLSVLKSITANMRANARSVLRLLSLLTNGKTKQRMNRIKLLRNIQIL